MRAPMGPAVLVSGTVVAMSAHRDGVACRRADRADDVLVARAAAEVSLQAAPDVLVGELAVALPDQVDRVHDHPWRAEAALQAVVLPEGLLHGVQLSVLRDALDRGDRRPVGLDGEQRAGFDRAAVEVDRAGAALAGVAADLRAGQAEAVPDEVDEQRPRLDVGFPLDAVDGHRDPCHLVPPLPKGCPSWWFRER